MKVPLQLFFNIVLIASGYQVMGEGKQAGIHYIIKLVRCFIIGGREPEGACIADLMFCPLHYKMNNATT